MTDGQPLLHLRRVHQRQRRTRRHQLQESPLGPRRPLRLHDHPRPRQRRPQLKAPETPGVSPGGAVVLSPARSRPPQAGARSAGTTHGSKEKPRRGD